MNHLKKFSIGAAFALLLPLTALYSQTQPVLQSIKFLNNGNEISETSQAAIVIQLEFDQAMNTAVAPTISAGLEPPYNIDLTFSGQLWVNNTIWQGPITITDEVPSEDGTYIFKISGAKNAGNVAMDTTLSTAVGNKTLRICRTGQIFAQLGAINYPTINAGAYSETLLILQNFGCGDADLSVSLGLPSFPFSVTNYTAPFVIGGGGQVGLVVRFYPSQRGTYADNLVINSNDPDQPVLTIPLAGIAVAPEIETDPLAAIDFGSVNAGVSYTDTVMVYNLKALNAIWDANLVVSNVSIIGDQAFVAGTNGFVVAPGDSFKIPVSFSSSARAAYSATLRLTTNDPDEPGKDILLYANSTDISPPPQPINVTGSWYLNYYPFWINTGQICIYWTNPVDPSGIAEVRWKFGAPPTGPNDTTNTQKGVNISSFCYQIPLIYQNGGYYTVYYWLVDGLGNSGWQFNYRSFSYTYDASAPAAPLNASISNSNWTNASSLNIFWTNPTATAGDFYEVRWKLQSRPTSNTDITGSKLIAPPFTGQQSFTAYFDSRFCGNDTLFFWLADSAGNADFQNPAFVQYKYDSCRPFISRLWDQEVIAAKQTAFQDTILITDDSYVDSAWVAYRFGGAEAVVTGFAYPLPRVAGSPNKFLLNIPKDAVTTRGLEYIIIARDSLGNRYAHGPGDDCYYDDDDDYGDGYYYDGYVPFANDEDAWHAVQVRGDATVGEYRIDTNNNPVTLPAGTDQLSYNLVSIPFILDDGRARTVLVDDLGPADSTEWRFFEYVTADQQWAEYPNTSNFEPGRAFFLIVSDAGKYIRSGAGTTVATVCPDTIALQPGWNLIGNPFNFNVDDFEGLIPINFLNQLTVYSYEKIGWNINLPNGIEPWRGYAVYVQPLDPLQPIYLLVIPKAINPQSGKAAAVTAAPDEWTMQITASAGLAKDEINWMGVKKNAAAEYDANDLFEPPVIGKYVSLYFPHKEWTTLPQNYTADYRPLAADGYVWDFEVATAKGHEMVTLNFDGMDEVPAGLEVYLIDEQLGAARNLRQNPSYSFRANSDGGKKTLRVVVGSRNYVETNSNDVTLVPAAFDLAQNFPNPFNPETVIRYSLPEAATVTLEIYNMLGQKVRTLVDHTQQAADFYSLSWNGRDDNGKALASGVYLYRLSAGSYVNTRKMVLMK
jgi:hypothetical protein